MEAGDNLGAQTSLKLTWWLWQIEFFPYCYPPFNKLGYCVSFGWFPGVWTLSNDVS